MTHREHRSEFERIPQEGQERGWQDVLTLLADQGFEGFANAMQILLNEAMKLEREAALGWASQAGDRDRVLRPHVGVADGGGRGAGAARS